MKILLASVSWFLAAWFVYDATAYLLGVSRQVTPLVALAVALGVGFALWTKSMRRASFRILSGAPDPDLGGIG
jgi:hypothetical protein